MMESSFQEQPVQGPFRAKGDVKVVSNHPHSHENHDDLRKAALQHDQHPRSTIQSIHDLAKSLNRHLSSHAAQPYQPAAYYPASPIHAA